MSTTAAFQILDEYASVLHVMRDRPVKTVEEYVSEYRLRFETSKVVTRATAPPAARPQPTAVRNAQDQRRPIHEHHAQSTAASRQQQSLHTPTRDSARSTENVIAAISETRRQRREAEADADLTFHPVTTKMAQHHQPSNKCWHERLYIDDVQKREQHALIKQQLREAEKRREEEDELHELSLAHREATVPTEKLYNRLYTSGRSHERWIRMQHQLQNDILAGVIASGSPSRRKSAERSSSVRRHGSVFEDLYHAARQRQEDQQQQQQQQQHAPRCSSDVSTRHVDTPNHTSSSLIRKNTSSPSRHVEQVHQRLYNEATERQQQLQAVQEERRAASVEGMFHPNLEMARRESMIKPHADERVDVSFSAGDTTPLPSSTRRRSLSPVIIAGVDVLDVKTGVSSGGAADAAFGDLLRLESTDSLSAPQPQHTTASSSHSNVSRSVATTATEANVAPVQPHQKPSPPQQAVVPAAAAPATGPAVPSLTVRPNSATGSITPPPAESPYPKAPVAAANGNTGKKLRTDEEEKAHQQRKKERREHREREKIERQRARPLDEATAQQLARAKEATPPPASSHQTPPGSHEVSPRAAAAAVPKLPASFRRQGVDSAVLKPAPVKPSAAEDPFAAVAVEDQVAAETQHARAASIDLRKVLEGPTDVEARIARKQSRKALIESMAILESDKED